MTTPSTTDKTTLRRFGLVLGGMIPLWFGLLLAWLFDYGGPVWPWIMGAILALIALAMPLALKPLFRAWTAVGHVMGWINTRILLGLVFFLLITPLGLVMRLLGKRPLKLHRDAQAESYREPSAKRSPHHLENPY